MPLIEVHNLGVRYPRTVDWAVRGLSFTVERGETLLLLGPSGSGKSTVGLCLAGLIPASLPARLEGRIILDGQDAAILSVGERTARFGLVFQDPEAQFCMLAVEDEVAFGLENLAMPPAAMQGRIAEALALVGLADRRRERVDRLSGGQKQRLALACALARQPEILFLDEPTANLDSATRADFLDWLAALKRQRPDLTLIVVEHILDELIAQVDRVLVLDRACLPGPCVAGSPAQVFDRSSAELDALGIWLPQVTALGHKLRLAGLPFAGLPLTVEQATATLAPLLKAHRLPQPTRFTPGDAPAAIAVRDLTYAYPGGPTVLHHVDLDVPAGSLFALVGPNGSGKSTLAAHLVDILPPECGRVRLLGQDLRDLTPATLADRIGYVFQNPEHQFVEQRVGDELAYSLRLRQRPPDEIEATVTRLLDEFGLSGRRDANPFALSQGQKRRLSVATMLALGQRILVLDEPTFGQDRATAHALMGRLLALHARGVTVCMITHDMQLVADYAERVAVLVDGRVRWVGDTGAFFTQERLLAEAALRPLALHALARALDVAYGDGTPPLSLRDWFPFFGLPTARADGDGRADR